MSTFFGVKSATEYSSNQPSFPQVLLHVLFEHAAGYALFAVKEVEEIGMLLPQVSFACSSDGLFVYLVFALLYVLHSVHIYKSNPCVSGGGKRPEHWQVQQCSEASCILPFQVCAGCSGEHKCRF